MDRRAVALATVLAMSMGPNREDAGTTVMHMQGMARAKTMVESDDMATSAVL